MLGVEGKSIMEVRPEEVKRVWVKHYDKGVRDHIDYPEIPLYSLFEESAKKNPNKTALIFYGKKISYRELNELSDRVAGYLYSLGIRKGGKVCSAIRSTLRGR